jgi:predicted DNA-binding protein
MTDQETKAFALRLPAPVYNRVKNLSFFTDRSMNEIIVAAVSDYLDRTGDQVQLEAMANRVRSEYRTVLDKLRDL